MIVIGYHFIRLLYAHCAIVFIGVQIFFKFQPIHHASRYAFVKI